MWKLGVYLLVPLVATCCLGRVIEEMELAGPYDVHDNAVDAPINNDGFVSRLGWYKVAFMTYLSEDETMLGKEQPIKFDKVLLNDRNAYEAATGIFRAPVSGVYQFTFVVAQRHANEIRVNLMHDGNVVVGAIAEGMQKYNDAQGTNTALIHVVKGNAVWVQAENGDHLEGDLAKFRYTTFSGHLVYARK